MKKFIFVLLLLNIFFLFAAEKKNYKVHADGGYSIACPRCKEKPICGGCNMWRMHKMEIGEHEYLIYRCKHGHTLYVRYDGTAELK